MNVFLNIYGASSAVALLLAIAYGYQAADSADLGNHVLLGLISVLAAILGLTIILFYFIATGSVIKKTVISGRMDVKSHKQAAGFKKALFPWLMTTIALLMITPMLGAAYDAGKASVIYHSTIAWLAVALYVFTLVKARRIMRENKPIFHTAVIETGKEENS